LAHQQEMVSLEWAKWLNTAFLTLKKRVDSLFLDFHRESREQYERWLLLKRLLVPIVEKKVLAWQKENPHSKETDATKWIRSFATSDQELLLYTHTWHGLVKQDKIKTESHGRGIPRTYSIKKEV